MIGECASLAPRKNGLNLFNLVMSLLAGIFMIVSCASYSANTETIQKLSFMVLTTTTTQTGQPKKVTCKYIALQGYCETLCDDAQKFDSTGKNIVNLPTDDPLRNCATGQVTGLKNGKPVYAPTVVLYKTAIETNKCSTTTDAATKTMCTMYKQCQNGGNVTIAFAAIGCVAALFSMVAFAWRMNSDGVCPKLISVGLAIGTFIACTVAYAGFQPCATTIYNDDLAANDALKKLSKDINTDMSPRPGVGGAMAVTSFVFFIYVMFMSIFIPSAGPAGTNAGLDNKAPQV